MALGDDLPHIEPDRVAGGVVKVFGGVGVQVISPPQTAVGKVPEGVVVRGVFPLGAESPLIPVAKVALVEADHIVVEKIGLASPSGAAQLSLGDHGIALQERIFGVESCREPVPHFSEKPSERPLGVAQSELHLADVTRFVHGKLSHPGMGLAGVHLGKSVGVQPFRSPRHRTV